MPCEGLLEVGGGKHGLEWWSKSEYEMWLRDFGLVELTEAETGVCGPQRVETDRIRPI